MTLKGKINLFLEDTGAPVTAFCRKVGISPTYYYKFMNDEIELSDKLTKRIVTYLKDVYARF